MNLYSLNLSNETVVIAIHLPVTIQVWIMGSVWMKVWHFTDILKLMVWMTSCETVLGSRESMTYLVTHC